MSASTSVSIVIEVFSSFSFFSSLSISLSCLLSLAISFLDLAYVLDWSNVDCFIWFLNRF